MKILPYLLKQPHKLSRTLLATTTALSLCCGSALANATDNLWKNSFEGGIDIQTYKYREAMKPWSQHHDKYVPFIMQDKGMMYGVRGSYQLTYYDSFFLRGEVRGSHGRVDYKNRYANGGKKYIPSSIFEARVLGGYLFDIFSGLKLGPYTGIGYYQKNDDTRDCTGLNGAIGRHQRVNRLGYIPFGIKGEYAFADKWGVSANIEYDWLFKGQNLTYDNQSIPSPLVFKQKKGWGFKCGLLVSRHFEKVSISFGPSFDHWNIDQTRPVAYEIQRSYARLKDCKSVEPSNTTNIFSFTFSIKY